MNMNYALAFMIVGILSAGQLMAEKPSSDDRDRKSEQRGSSKHTQDRQQGAAANKSSSVDRDREREQRRHSEYTRESERDRDERWGDNEKRDSDERWSSDERRGDDEKSEQRGDRRSDDRNKHFGDQQRSIVRDYYSNEFRRGNCPPGLAKKQNGCMPPGQAKKWSVGQQLPRDVIFHNLPSSLATQFGQPPAGLRYVQVEDDILLITSRTGKVIDAISVLGNQ